MDTRITAKLALALALIASTIVLAPGGAAADTRAQTSTSVLGINVTNVFGPVIGLVTNSGKSSDGSGSGNSGSGSSGSGNSGSGDSGSGNSGSGNSGSEDPSGSDDTSKEKGKSEENKGKAKAEVPVVVPGAAPSIAKSFNAAPVAGEVRVRLPGKKTATELPAAASLPVGAIVDARAGVAKVTSAKDASGATQTARFTQGVFKVTQARAAHPITEIVLRGGHLGQCKRAAKAGTATISKRRRSSGRRLWAEGKGRFRTRGRDGAATVRGTGWITTDTCSGTRVKVRHGLVEVRDFGLKKTVMVPGGKSYFAKHRGRSKR